MLWRLPGSEVGTRKHRGSERDEAPNSPRCQCGDTHTPHLTALRLRAGLVRYCVTDQRVPLSGESVTQRQHTTGVRRPEAGEMRALRG